MAETQQNATSAALARLIKAGRQHTRGYIDKCPANRRFYQLAPNKATPLWLVGHVANTMNFIGLMVGLGESSRFPREWAPSFTPETFGGKPITTQPGDYPPWEEVARLYDEVCAAFAEAVAALDEASLQAEPKGRVPDPLKGRLTSAQDAIFINIQHDAHHRGQLALLINAPFDVTRITWELFSRPDVPLG